MVMKRQGAIPAPNGIPVAAMSQTQNRTDSSQALLEAITTASMPPADAFAKLREYLMTSDSEIGVEKTYDALRGLVWNVVSSRDGGDHLNGWTDVVLRVRQLLRTKSSRIAERFTVLADLLDQSFRFAKLHPSDELLSRKHIRTVLEVLLAHHGTATRATIAERIGLRDANMSRVLSNLASAGWISRRPDGREIVVSLTEEGKAQARTALPKAAVAAAASPFSTPTAIEVMQTLWDKTGCAAAVSDDKRGLLSCDKKFASLFGVESPDLLVGTDVATLRQNLAEMVSAPDEVAPDEIALKDGSVMRVVEFESGNRSLWLGVDVTPYKRQLEEYKRRERLLLHRIDSATQRRSKPAVLPMHYADYGVAALPMISTLRNDLLTPINTINSFAQLLSKCDMTMAEPTFRELLTGILAQSTQLRTLLRDIVNVGHLVDSATRTRAEPDRIKPSALVKDVLGNLNYTARHAHLFIQEGTISSKTVETDERAFRAVMLQALTGIVEMTPAGGKVGVEADLRRDTIVLRIATPAADRDFAAVVTASKTLSMCEHAARFYGGGFEFTSGSDSGIAAELHWPLQPAKRQRRASAR